MDRHITETVVLPRATKNLSYRQLYKFLTKSPKIGRSGRTWITSGALINYTDEKTRLEDRNF